MWGVMVLLFGMMFHSRSGSKRKRKTGTHRQFYRDGRMTHEMEALEAMHETMEFEAYREKKGK